MFFNIYTQLTPWTCVMNMHEVSHICKICFKLKNISLRKFADHNNVHNNAKIQIIYRINFYDQGKFIDSVL